MNKFRYFATLLYVLTFLGAGEIFAQENKTSSGTVSVPFGSFSEERVVTSAVQVDMRQWQDKLSDNSWKTILENAGFGMFTSADIRGEEYVVMIDGLIRDGSESLSSLSDFISIEQIESITILKDVASRMLYGSYADKGIIMITTKSGHVGKRKINVTYKSDFNVPVSLPGYMDSADYMILYNEARGNDGLSKMYSYEQIEAARSGEDSVQYPSTDYYGSGDFLKSFKPQHKVSVDFSGGNKTAKYYLQAGYYNTGSLIANADQSTNRFNINGKVDINLGKWVEVSLGTSAVFNSGKGINWLNKNFWNLTTSERVNAYPLLIPIDRIREEDSGIIEEAYAQKAVINDKYLLGGSSVFTQNLYGDLNLGGYANTMDRMAQINVGINVDFGFITKGLRFKTYFANDNYNRYTTTQKNKYAIYSPTVQDDGTIAIEKIGVNDFVGSQSMSNVAFYRRYGWTNALGYDRVFGGKHDVSAVLTSVMHSYKESGASYSDRSTNFGLRVNYMFDRKLVAEYDAACIGSARFARDNRWGYAQSFSAGWIITGHEFMRNVSWLDFLKAKASFAMGKTDIDSELDGYWLYRNAYSAGKNFSYGDGAGSNYAMSVTVGNPSLGWIRKNDFNVGVEAAMFDRQLSFEANYYRTYRYDEPVRRIYTRPTYIGGEEFLPYENYGSRTTDGIEAKLAWRRSFGDFSVDLCGTLLWYSPTLRNCDEIDYGEGMEYRQKSGKASDAIWGYVADGLYTQEEIDAINSGAPDAVIPSFGQVQAGDVKYRDLNGDRKIDDDDLTVIGNTHARFNYGLQMNFKYKNLGLYVHMFAQTGGSSLYMNSYYNVYGERKYPEFVKGRWAYDPENGIDTRATATYPRLTTLQNTNNFKESSYWLGKTDYFAIPDLQLSWNFGDRVLSALKMTALSVYVKASNLLLVGPDADKLQLNIGSEPQYRTWSVGLNMRF